MDWSRDVLFPLVSNGLCRLDQDGFRQLPDGSWFFSGPPRGPGWHRHGTASCKLLDLDDGEIVDAVLRKQRWLEVATGRTDGA